MLHCSTCSTGNLPHPAMLADGNRIPNDLESPPRASTDAETVCRPPHRGQSLGDAMQRPLGKPFFYGHNKTKNAEA
jgi:hypothetical protein